MNASVYVAHCDVGLGIFASKPLAIGDHILTFAGRRVDSNDPMHHTPDGANLLQTGKNTYIYPNTPGLYVNHSCNPNAGISRGRRLLAIRPIKKDEEIRFDYSTTMDDKLWTMDCKCQDPQCRGVVRDFDELPSELQEKYIQVGIIPRYLIRSYRNDMISAVFPVL